MTAIYTQEEVDTLKAAIVSGVMVVSYDGPPKRSVQYHSLKEMRDLLAAMIADIAAAAGTRTTLRYPTVRKGFYPGSNE